MEDIIVGRNEADREKFGKRGTILLGRHYIQMGRTTSLSNNILLDVAGAHVVFICGKRGGGKCLHENTLITLNDGSQKKIKKLRYDDHQILALNQDLKVKQAEKSEFYKREVNKLLKIKLRSGKEVKLTPEHPLLTIEGWKPAESLAIGSRLATPRKIEAFGEKSLSEAETKLMAYLVAEGHLGNNFVLFSNRDEKIVADFKRAVNDFDSELKVETHSKSGCFRIAKRENKAGSYVIYRNQKGRFKKGTKYFPSKSSIRKWLDHLGIYGLRSIERILPSISFRMTKEKTALLLNRLFSCDGSIYFDKRKGWIVSYASSSPELIRQVHHLLLKFSILSKIREKFVITNNKCFRTYELIVRSEGTHKFLQEIGFFGKKEKRVGLALRGTPKSNINTNLDTIPKEIWNHYRPENWAAIGKKMNYATPKALRSSINYAPSRQKLLQIAELDNREQIKKIAQSDIFWDEIVKIEELNGKFTVYDITVPEHHNFIANDIIVHNSYTMGVIAEGFHLLEEEVKQNLSIILLDTMGIYWTTKYPNKQDEKLLEEWGMKPDSVPVDIYTPHQYFKKFKAEGIPTDHPFSLDASEIDPEDWCNAFKKERYGSEGVLIARIVLQLRENMEKTGKKFGIDDIIKLIIKDETSDNEIKDSVESMFLMAKSWGVFSDNGTPIGELAKPGKITVLDVSCYATLPGGWDVKALIVGTVSKHLFIERMVERKKEEHDAVQSALHYFGEADTDKQQKMPLVWLVLDEAHEFLPRDGKVASTDALVTIMREGRQPGISLILATQQPGKIHTDVMTQSDTVISHRITAKIDVDALGMLMQSYMRTGLVQELDKLPRVKGAGIIFDDSNEKMYPLRIRPRISWHGGGAPSAVHIKKKFGL